MNVLVMPEVAGGLSQLSVLHLVWESLVAFFFSHWLLNETEQDGVVRREWEQIQTLAWWLEYLFCVVAKPPS